MEVKLKSGDESEEAEETLVMKPKTGMKGLMAAIGKLSSMGYEERVVVQWLQHHLLQPHLLLDGLAEGNGSLDEAILKFVDQFIKEQEYGDLKGGKVGKGKGKSKGHDTGQKGRGKSFREHPGKNLKQNSFRFIGEKGT